MSIKGLKLFNSKFYGVLDEHINLLIKNMHTWAVMHAGNTVDVLIV